MNQGLVKAIVERAVRAFAVSLGGMLTADGVFDVFTFDWRGALTAALSATVYSVLTSAVASKVGGPGPSFGPERLNNGPTPLQ